MDNLSLSDIASVTGNKDGFLEGNGIIILILFFLIFGFGGGAWGNNQQGTCLSQKRDRSVICVVESPRDIKSIERTHEYNGLYHVLHGLISPMDGIGAEQLCIKELLARLNDTVKEVIMATSPTVEGEATAMYLAKLIKPMGIKTTRLAYGLPVGSSLEYADETTLYRAMQGRGEL